MVDLETLREARVIPVVRAPTAAEATRLSELLIASGFGIIELTMTTPGALGVLQSLMGEARVGMGTVLSPSDASAAIAAGAAFVVTPCLVRNVPETCSQLGVPFVLGAMTPSEIREAHESGAIAVKVFPAASLGGPDYLRHIRAVFPAIPLMPTGGIREVDVQAYLDAGALAVGMGGDLLAGSDDDIVERGRRVLGRARRFAS